MKRSIKFLISIICFYQYSQCGNNTPAPPKYEGVPKQKSCVAPEGSTCTVSLSDVKDGSSRMASCTAQKGAECTVVLNAIEEIPVFDIKALPVKSFGTIAKDTIFTIDLPKKEGDSVVFSFTPTAGELANKELNVVVHKIKTQPGTRLFGKTALKIYRFIAGDKPDNWQKMGEFESDRPVESLSNGVATVKPDGTALIPASVEGVPPVALALGAKKTK